MIKVGDIVKVTNPGVSYPSYRAMRDYMGLEYFRYDGDPPEQGEICRVLAVKRHFSNLAICLGIRTLHRARPIDYIIDMQGGVKKHAMSIHINSDMFQLE